MTRDEAKLKIAKLMAMGTCAGANENEAEAALRQASFLMKAHAIEQAEIADRTGTAQEFSWSAVHVPLDPANPVKTAIGWIGNLAVGIARFTDTKASYSTRVPYGKCVAFEGETFDVEYAAYLMKHLRDTIRSMSRDFGGNRADSETYRVGMVARLRERMKEYQTQRETDLRATRTATGSAMVITDRKIAERNAVFGAASYSKARRTYSGSASAMDNGRAAGERVGFGRPLGGSGGKVRALTAG